MPQPATRAASATAATATRADRETRGVSHGSRNIGGDGSTRPRHDITAAMTADARFLAAADATLHAIADAVERAIEGSDVDADWRLADGILEIDSAGGARIVVNRHGPNREIWVAAKSGGFHYRAVDGRWRDSRGGGELGAALAAILEREAGLAVDRPALAAPAQAG